MFPSARLHISARQNFLYNTKNLLKLLKCTDQVGAVNLCHCRSTAGINCSRFASKRPNSRPTWTSSASSSLSSTPSTPSFKTNQAENVKLLPPLPQFPNKRKYLWMGGRILNECCLKPNIANCSQNIFSCFLRYLLSSYSCLSTD